MTVDDLNNLRACPFCGADPILNEIAAHSHSGALKALIPDIPDHAGSWTIECPTEGCAGMIADSLDQVTGAWNRRQPDAGVVLTDERIEEIFAQHYDRHADHMDTKGFARAVIAAAPASPVPASRNEILEEAARECDAAYEEQRTAYSCAIAIRALKSNPKEGA
jgi:hypothetical protein